MRLILHIFRKDAIHLLKEIAVMWALLAWLTQMDCWRSGYLPGSTEGWLNLLLPLTWSYLAAVCVLQDAVPGERQFWLALPAGRGTMFGAKALFAAVFIHAPYLISCAAVIAAHGFNPLMHLPRLLEKQMVLFAAVTLPALALASIARNAMQYLLLAIALAGTAVLVSGYSTNPFQNQWPPASDLRWVPVSLALALFAVAVLWMQYRDRRTQWSRGIGFAGVLGAVALYLWLPARSSASLEAAIHPLVVQGPITVRADQPEANRQAGFPPRSGVAVSIPIEIAGLNKGVAMYPQLDFEIAGPGIHFRVAGGAMRDAHVFAVMGRKQGDQYHLNVMMEPAAYKSAAHVPVTLKGHFAAVETNRVGGYSLSDSERAGLGRCTDSVTGDRLYREGGLRVVCESPHAIPRARLALTDTSTGRHWEAMLGEARGFVNYPTLTWLSPVNRSEAYFQLTSRDASQAGDWWLVPRTTLEHYKFEITVEHVTGTAVVGYELQEIELSRYLAKDSR